MKKVLSAVVAFTGFFALLIYRKACLAAGRIAPPAEIASIHRRVVLPLARWQSTLRRPALRFTSAIGRDIGVRSEASGTTADGCCSWAGC